MRRQQGARGGSRVVTLGLWERMRCRGWSTFTHASPHPASARANHVCSQRGPPCPSPGAQLGGGGLGRCHCPLYRVIAIHTPSTSAAECLGLRINVQDASLAPLLPAPRRPRCSPLPLHSGPRIRAISDHQDLPDPPICTRHLDDGSTGRGLPGPTLPCLVLAWLACCRLACRPRSVSRPLEPCCSSSARHPG